MCILKNHRISPYSCAAAGHRHSSEPATAPQIALTHADRQRGREESSCGWVWPARSFVLQPAVARISKAIHPIFSYSILSIYFSATRPPLLSFRSASAACLRPADTENFRDSQWSKCRSGSADADRLQRGAANNHRNCRQFITPASGSP